MKRVNFKSILMALVVTLSFLLAGAEQANAQGVQSGLYTPPTGVFVNSDQAQTLLFDVFMLEKQQNLVAYAQGTPAFNALYRKILYYVAIRENLINGLSVQNAIVEGLKDFPLNASGVGATPKQLQSLKDQAIELLKI